MPNIIPLPTSTFQAPGFVHPKDYSGLAQSIDSIFTAYQQGQMRKAQLDQAQLQPQLLQQQLANAQQTGAIQGADYRMQNFGLSPQDVTQNMGAAMQQAPGSLYAATQQGSPMRPDQMAQAGANSNPNAYANPGQEDPKVAVLRQILQMHMQGAQTGAQQQQAGLQNVQANIGKTQAETEKLNAENAMLGGGGGIVSGLTDAVKTGRMAPDAALSNLGRGDLANSIRLGVTSNLAGGGTDVVGLQNAADKSNATAKYEGGPDVQGKSRTAQSISADANVLKDLSTKLGKDDWQAINKLGLAVAAQRGSVPAQEILDQAKLVADRFQALVGGGSDAKLELGLNLFDAAKTPAQLARSVDRVNESLKNYSSSLQGKGTTPSDIPDANKKPASKWDGGATHTYPDGTVAKWTGSAWVKAH